MIHDTKLHNMKKIVFHRWNGVLLDAYQSIVSDEM